MNRFYLTVSTILVALLLVLAIHTSKGETPLSEPIISKTYYVIDDQANLLNGGEKLLLRRMSDNVNARKNVQIVVHTIDTIPNDLSVEQYANLYFNTKGIGKKDVDRGILIMLSMKPKKVIRIEVGRGNEGWLPDHKSGEVADAAIPDFLKKKWFEGFEKSIQKIYEFAGD